MFFVIEFYEEYMISLLTIGLLNINSLTNQFVFVMKKNFFGLLHRFLRLFAFFASLFVSVIIKASGEIKVGDLYYRTDGSTAIVVKYPGSEYSSFNRYKGTIRIPDFISYNGKQYSVTAIDDKAFYVSEIDTLYISDSVERIGIRALSYSNLARLYIGANLKYIGEGAFTAGDMEEIIINPANTALVIRNHVLYTSDYERALGLFFPKNVTANVSFAPECKHIDDFFTGARRLETLYFNKNVEYIGESAFNHALENTSSQRELYIPNSCTYIGPEAFYMCIRLDKIHLPEGLTRLEPYSFSYCAPTSINIPKTMKVICDGALSCTAGGTYKDLVLPEGLDSLGCFAITSIDCDSLIVPSTVRYMSANCLCNSSKYIEIRCQLDSIPAKAMPSQGVKKLVLPKSVKKLGLGAFYPCYNLKEIVWPDNLEHIGQAALAGNKCDPLEIPATVKILDYYSLADNVWEPRRYVFYSKEPPTCTSLDVFNGIKYDESTLYVPTGCKAAYEKYAPWNWFGKIEELDGPWVAPEPELCYDFESDGLYYNVLSEEECTCELTCNFVENRSIYKGNVTVPGYVHNDGKTYSVIKIGDNAFYYSQVKEVTLPEEVDCIGENAFCQCSNLEKVTMPKTLAKMGCGAFACCGKLKDIQIPYGLTLIPEGAFEYCEELTTITIPLGVTELEPCAFCRCSQLQSVQLPNSLKVMQEYVFADCKALSSIVLPPNLEVIYGQAFQQCTALKDVYSLAITPPRFDGYNQFEVSKTNRLHVMKGCRNAYYNGIRWKYYFDIIEDVSPSVGIMRVIQDENSSKFVHDMTGRKVSGSLRGMYIKGGKKFVK